jgi:ketosteroid isomerase-like protein
MMITREFARQFAEEWIAAWNSHDLEKILSHYSDDFVMSSPRIVLVVGEKSGILQGKDVVRTYWKRALELTPDLRFELISYFVGADSLVVLYKSVRGIVTEVFFFGADGEVVKAAANYA